MSNHLMPLYARQPVAFKEGLGTRLWDTNGKEYLDLLAGIAVVNLGHGHPEVTKALVRQAGKLIQTSNGFQVPEQSALADKLCEKSGMDNVFFCSTGTESIETAIKIARHHGQSKGIEVPTIICMEKAFHGRTMGAISATGNKMVREGFDPLLPGFIHVPFNDAVALEEAIKTNDNVVAVLLEPTQGEGGIRVPDADYLPKVRQLCDEHELFMMLDEIQSGVGRTGELFAFQHHDFTPDVMTLAKGLGNGYPIGACVAKGKAAEVLKVGQHGTTFGGGPLASVVGLTVLEVIENEGILEHTKAMADRFISGLKQSLGGHDAVKEVRGQGLWIGIELHEPCAELRLKGLEAGLVFSITAGSVIRLAPPLIISGTEVDQGVEGLTQLIHTHR